jgi:hypothetical protein
MNPITPLVAWRSWYFTPKALTIFRFLTRKQLGDRYSEFLNRTQAVAWLNEGVPADKVLTVEDTRPHWKA